MEFVIQVSLTKNPESTTWNPELNHSIKFRMQDGLGFPHMSWGERLLLLLLYCFIFFISSEELI